MKKRKIIFIGLNKTGTVSIHQTFLQNGFKSIHGRDLCWAIEKFWNSGEFDEVVATINKHDVVSDWCTRHISRQALKRLYHEFPNALFVLNTRSLSDWVRSRLIHYLLSDQSSHRGGTGSRIDEKMSHFSHFKEICMFTALGCVDQRELFYRDVCDVFEGSDNLIVLDIADSLFYNYISEEIGKDIVYDGRRHNVTRRNLKPETKRSIEQALQTIATSYEGEDVHTKLTLDEDLNKRLLTFKNNIK